MCRLIAIIACIVGLFALVMMHPGRGATAESIGQMPEVVVTAEREYSGLLDTVFVTELRDNHTDTAWSGLLDTVVVKEPVRRYSRGSAVPVLTYRSPLGIMIDDLHRHVE